VRLRTPPFWHAFWTSIRWTNCHPEDRRSWKEAVLHRGPEAAITISYQADAVNSYLYKHLKLIATWPRIRHESEVVATFGVLMNHRELVDDFDMGATMKLYASFFIHFNFEPLPLSFRAFAAASCNASMSASVISSSLSPMPSSSISASLRIDPVCWR
jgi:hypothetical protein